jgi:TRAP-type mannitol/chloroaromatic compound transport system substrate-binding protein
MGGWFRKKINTLADYKGLKMRIAGLGGQVIGKAGATAVLTPPPRSTPRSSAA